MSHQISSSVTPSASMKGASVAWWKEEMLKSLQLHFSFKANLQWYIPSALWFTFKGLKKGHLALISSTVRIRKTTLDAFPVGRVETAERGKCKLEEKRTKQLHLCTTGKFAQAGSKYFWTWATDF